MSALAVIAARAPGGCRQRRERKQLRRVRELTLLHFLADGDWPYACVLQKELARWNETFDVRSAAARMPAGHGFVDARGRIVLTPAGMCGLVSARELLAGFVGAVRLGHERYLASGARDARISARDLTDAIGLSKRDAERVAKLLDTVTELFTHRARIAGRRIEWTIDESIRHYASVVTIDEYLTVREQQLPPRRRPQARPPLTRRLRELVARNWEQILVGFIAALLAGIVIGLLALDHAGSSRGRDPRAAPHLRAPARHAPRPAPHARHRAPAARTGRSGTS